MIRRDGGEGGRKIRGGKARIGDNGDCRCAVATTTL